MPGPIATEVLDESNDAAGVRVNQSVGQELAGEDHVIAAFCDRRAINVKCAIGGEPGNGIAQACGVLPYRSIRMSEFVRAEVRGNSGYVRGGRGPLHTPAVDIQVASE